MKLKMSKIDISSMSPAVQRAFLDAQIKSDLGLFTQLAFEIVVPGEQLHLNWHLRAISYALQKVVDRKVKRLIITLPPRSLKSITTSVAFPAFVLGHDPSKKIIGISYSADLAAKQHNDFRQLLSAPQYRRLFPAVRVSPTKNTEQEVITTMRGGRYSTSVGGTLTGRGGNIIILDDPMNSQQAFSASERETIIRYFRGTVLSRLNSKDDDAIVIIMQRLHMDDLAGVLLEEGGWVHLNIPAIAETNERITIGPGQYHHRRAGSVIDKSRESREALDAIKRGMGSMQFSAQYQQRPIPLAGNIIKRAWLRYYDVLPTERGRIVISWDTAMKPDGTSDYSVGTIWHRRSDECYLMDVIRGRFNFPTLKSVVISTRARYLGCDIIVEDKGSGTSLIQELRRLGMSVHAVTPKGDKLQRLAAASTLFESGMVHFPKKANWLADYEEELLGFPSVRHDDQVDSTSQALNFIKERSGGVFHPIVFSLNDPLFGTGSKQNSDPVFRKPWQRSMWDNW